MLFSDHLTFLGLSPRAALVVQKKDQQGVVTQGQGPGRFFSAGEGREERGMLII